MPQKNQRYTPVHFTLSHKEIAEATGISEGIVKNRLHYAITKLCSRLPCILRLHIMSAILWINGVL